PEAHPVIDKNGSRFARATQMTWQEGNAPAGEIKALFVDQQRGYNTFLVRMAPGAMLRPHRHADVEESYLLEGDLLVSGVEMKAGDYCRAEPGSLHAGVTTRGGCVFITVCSQRDELLA
ncbi:MAG: cupin domain-containing protein, partial [Deltaproteobacteria bacterium]|nr:cupin domain-containing protein [Deltaproteobacteria bacterium]